MPFELLFSPLPQLFSQLPFPNESALTPPFPNRIIEGTALGPFSGSTPQAILRAILNRTNPWCDYNRQYFNNPSTTRTSLTKQPCANFAGVYRYSREY